MRGNPTGGYPVERHGWLANNAHGAIVQAGLYSLAKLRQRLTAKDETLGISGVDILLPTQFLHHADGNAIRMMCMPVIVKTENGDVVLANEIEFVLEGGIVLNFFGCVLVNIEGGFVGNDHVLARTDCSFDHIERGHHGDRNTLHNSIRVSG